MDDAIRDLRHALRTLRRAPGFTLAAVGTLALALGANAGIFAVVDAVLLRPFPFEEPDRLVHIAASAPGSDLPEEFGVSAEFYVQYRDEAENLSSLATFNWFTATARVGDRVERIGFSMHSPALFATLGVTPFLGRLPEAGEEQRVAVLSHGMWLSWFGGDPSAVGREVWMVDGPKTVVGVMGPDFGFPSERVEAWIPMEIGAGDLVPGRFGIQLVGRLAPGADRATLTDELDRLADRLPELYGGPPAYARIIEQHVPVVRPLNAFILGPVSGALGVLMGAVLVVLLIACANVTNLFAVRAEARGRELAVRRALGAARRRLVGVQLAEAVVVACVAGALAVGLAALLLPVLGAAAPGDVPRLGTVGLSATTLVFTAVAAGAAALACGLGPAVRASRANGMRLADGSRGSTRRRGRMRDALVVLQTALALVLLVASGLLSRSLLELKRVDPGYDTRDLLTFQFAPDEAHLVDGPTWAAFHLAMMDRIRALPGVESVGIVENVPLEESAMGVQFLPEGVADSEEAGSRGLLTFASPGYFETVGIAGVRGPGFTRGAEITPLEAVVSRSLAERLWPGEDPLGRRLRNSRIEPWHVVVGVVEDVVQNDLREPAEPMAYYPLRGPSPEAWALTSPGYVVRSTRTDDLMGEIRGLIREAAPSAPIYRVYTMEDLTARSTLPLSFTLWTLGVASGLALILGAVGLFGVLSQVVAERTREIGVRMALGAEAGRVRRMVVVQGVRVVALGIVLGLAVAAFSARALSSLLYGVAPFDLPTFVAMAVALAAVGLLASWLPALRASRLDPVRAIQRG